MLSYRFNKLNKKEQEKVELIINNLLEDGWAPKSINELNYKIDGILINDGLENYGDDGYPNWDDDFCDSCQNDIEDCQELEECK